MAVESPMNRLFQQAGTNKAPTGTGYTNLNRFLGANAGNQLGAKVSGNLQNQIGGVQNQLQEEKTSFEKEAEKNRLDTAENAAARDSIIGRFASPSTAGGTLGEEDVSKVTQFRTGQYAGPTGLKDTTALSQQAQDLAAQTGNLSSSGTQELLRRSIGGGRYTQGQQRLDSILMDRSGLRQVGREAQALGSDVNRANLAAQGQAQALKGQAEQFGQETTGKLQGALSGLDTAAQGQLATAQEAENQRLANIQAIQDFAAGKVAKKDEAGNVMKDQYGNTVYDTVNPRGTTDKYEQVDALQELLKSKGLQESELSALFGSGNMTQAGQASDATNSQRSALNQQLQKALDEATWTYDNERITQNMQAQSRKRANELRAQINALTGPDLSQQGIAGAAVQKGATESFFQNLAGILANSQAAQGLTESGVASDALRGNYSALQQLLGQGADLNKFSDTDQRYSAGKMLVDPEQLKRSLGL